MNRGKKMLDLTTIILTYNEELNIAECIKSIKNISKRIVVIDSYSNDQTVEIAKKNGAEVYQNVFKNQAQQFKYGLEKLGIGTVWVLRMDADERLTPDSAEELKKTCEDNMETDINGIIVPFEVTFLGKKLKHGGIYPFKKLVAFKFGLAEIEERAMDEHIYLLNGKSVQLKNISLHLDYKDLTTWIDKHNKYSSREILDYFDDSKKKSKNKQLNLLAAIKRFAKIEIYYKLPMGIRAYFYYLYRYYIKLGFLDGKEGKIFAFLQAYWYRFLVDAKIYEKKIFLNLEKNSEVKK